jgi:hypothetical protein
MPSQRKRDSKQASVFLRPEAGQTEDDVVMALAVPLIAAVNAWRHANGLGPLPESDRRVEMRRPRVGRFPPRIRR